MDEDKEWRSWKRQKNIGITVGIIMFIAGILMILFGSPAEVHHVENLKEEVEVNMWGPVLGGATIFGVIMTIAAFFNGRSTKRYTRDLIKEMRGEANENFKRMDKRTERIAELIVTEGEKTRELIKALKS